MTKILLVEDNELNRDMLSRRLRRRGYEVVLAMDGAEAVAIAQGQAFDLVLMDMSLPIMDGWEATRQIKANPATQNLPVIALTAHAMVGDRERALEAGCDDYDTKPIDLKRLLGKVKFFLPGETATGGATAVAAQSTFAGMATDGRVGEAIAPSPDLTPPDGPRILVVDDNADNRDLLTRRLQRRGYRSPQANSGEEALQILQEQPDIAIVLLDIMMPGMDGIETLRQIRQRHSRTQLPVVMVTAKSQSEDMVQAFEQGANDYITKPIDFNVALARIQSHLATVQTHQEHAPEALTPEALTPEALTPEALTPESLHPTVQIENQSIVKDSSEEDAAVKEMAVSRPLGEQLSIAQVSDAVQSHAALAERYQIQSTLAQEPLGPVAIARDLVTQSLVMVQTFDIPSSLLYSILSTALSAEVQQLESLQAQFPTLRAGQINQTLYIVHDLGPDAKPENLLQAELNQNQPWPLDSVLGLMDSLLQQLEPFHQQNQIHGGLNARCFVRRDGTPHLIDSGLGKRVLLRVSQQSAEYRKRLLMQRNYLPMEQRIGRPVLSSDLYALGFIGLQALTGCPLTELATASAGVSGSTWQQKFTGPALVSEWFESLVSHNPTERYPQAMVARATLRSLKQQLKGSPVMSP